MTKVNLSEKIEKKCATCGTTYQGTRASKYCSDKCRSDGSNSRRKQRTKSSIPEQKQTPPVQETQAPPTKNTTPPIQTTVPAPAEPKADKKRDTDNGFKGFFYE